MTRYNLLVLSNATEGMEEEFNRWYSEQHLGDVLKVPGFRCAQRFALNAGEQGAALQPWRYAAIYEFESEDPNLQFGELMVRAGSPVMPLSPALDVASAVTALLVPITERVVAS